MPLVAGLLVYLWGRGVMSRFCESDVAGAQEEGEATAAVVEEGRRTVVVVRLSRVR